MQYRILSILEKEPVGLIIIDSIAAIFRITDNYIVRANNFRYIVTILNNVSKKYDLGIVILNQVILNGDVPALGLSWANLVSTRMHIFKKPSIQSITGVSIQVRILKIIWAPNVPADATTFFITPEGVK